MAEILNQLIGSSSQYLQVFNIPGGAKFQPSTVWLPIGLESDRITKTESNFDGNQLLM